MRNYRRKVGALLVLALFIVNLAGCSLFQSEKTAIAGVDKKLELAVKYLAENKFKEAMLTYQEVIRIDSKNAAAYKGLGLTYVLQKKNTAAEKTLTDGLNALPDNEQLQLALAGFMLDQGKYGSAEAIYSELITKGGASVQAYQAYSDCLIQRGKMAEAIALLEIVAENNGQYGLKTLLAELYSENGQREEALETINQSLNMEPNQSNAYRLLAGLYEDKWMELLALGDRYIQQDQTLTGVLYRFIALYGMNRYDQLITEYEKLNPDIKEKAGIRLLAAEAYSQSDQQERAAESIQDLKLAEIKDAGMLAELASYYMGSGDKDNARKAALRGITMDSNVIENYVVMYRIYEKEDPVLARTWAFKYVLACPESYTVASDRLTYIGLNLGIETESEEVSASKAVVKAILIDRTRAVKHFNEHPDWPHENTYVYLDTKHNIAYKGYCKRNDPFNPVIERYRSPKIATKQQIPELLKRIKLSGDQEETREKYSLYLVPANGNWAWPVIFQGDLTFEEHLKIAGYSIDNIKFVDK